MGGGRWISQLNFGFATAGSFARRVLSLVGQTPRPAPPPVSTIGRPSVKRFQGRPMASGHRFFQEIWGDAMGQVASGWLSEPPPPLTGEGDTPFLTLGASNTAFGFAVVQDTKLRPCDDLRRNLTNVRKAFLTPKNSPSLCRMSEIAKAICHTFRGWAFIKGGRASAYKQLPLGPAQTNLTVVPPGAPRRAFGWNSFLMYSFSVQPHQFYTRTPYLAD